MAVAERVEIRPQAGPQADFLATAADIAIYGGAAYGGKTYALLLEPLRHVRNPAFGGVIFRRTYPQVTNEGGLWDTSEGIYPYLGARPKMDDLTWLFRSGAKVKFAHLQYEQDKLAWQGAQIPFIGWDELTHFTESQFWYLLSRNRSACGVRPYVRATCNPDADSWVASLIEWWIGPDGYALPERSGVLRWFVRDGDALHWADRREELEGCCHLPDGTSIEPTSLTFILSTIYDNRLGLKADPGYLAKLMAMPLVERERLLGDRERGGNWRIRPAAGKVFNRAWFEAVDAAPAGGEDCRFFDFAASLPKTKGDDPDYTASCKIRKVNGLYFVLDATNERVGPAEQDPLLKNTATQDRDAAQHAGARYRVRWEIEPGSASIRENRRLVSLLDGFDAAGREARGDKIQRAKALSAQALAGNVKLLRGPWVERWLKHMHAQPDYPHDDEMDAASGAYNELAGRRLMSA